jgi:hypothetical protein
VKISAPGMLAHRIFWGGLIAAFVFSSVPFLRGLARKSNGVSHPFHSTDACLQAILGSPNCSEKFVEVFQELGSRKPVLIFARARNETSSFFAMQLAYLAWPHDVSVTFVPGTNCEKQIAALDPAAASALIFCELDAPSWLPPGIHLGNQGTLVRLQQ